MRLILCWCVAIPWLFAVEVAYDAEGPLTEWVDLGGSGERAIDADIIRSQKQAHSGHRSLRFQVRPGSVVAGGNRAELTYDRKEVPGSVGSYGWHVFIPESLVDVHLRDAEQRPNWRVIGQWHQQPRVDQGEHWDAYRGRGESPPIALSYAYLGKDDPHVPRVMAKARQQGLPGFSDDLLGQSVLMLSVGTPPQTIAIHPVTKGSWHAIRLEILWSDTEAGRVQCWVDGRPLLPLPHGGANMWNDAPHFFKLGLYRNPSIPHTDTIYIDDIWMRTEGKSSTNP